MKKLKTISVLFFTMLKIGLFTFGGGYAMISLLEREFVDDKKWIDHDEFMRLIAVAESTPGPIAVNCSTYIGYKISKFSGAVAATLGVVIPSFTIIYVISLFFNKFLEIKWVSAAFKGVQACVVFLILSAGLKMLKKLEKNLFNVIVCAVTFACMLAFGLFAVNFSSVFYVLISGFLGFLVYCVNKAKREHASTQDKERL